MVLRLSRKCDHSAYNLCFQFIWRTCARESPLSAVAVACSPCARAPRSRPLPLAPLTFRLASLPPSPSLRTIRRQRAAVVSHPLARPGTRLQPAPQPGTRGGTGAAGGGQRRRPYPGSDAVPAWAPIPPHRAGAVPAAPAVPNPSEPAFSSVLHFSALCPVAKWALPPPPRGARRARSPKPAAPPCFY